MSTNHTVIQLCVRKFYLASVFGGLLLATFPGSEILAKTKTTESLTDKPAFVGELTDAVGDGSAITPINANDVLNAVLNIITGKIYNDQFFALHELTESIIPTSTDYILQTDRDSYVSKIIDCPKNGNADITQRIEDNGTFDNSTYSFVDCGWENIIFNGESSEFKTDFGEFRDNFDELSLVDAQGQKSTLTGSLSRTLINDYGMNRPVGMSISKSEETVLTIEDTADTLFLDVAQTSLISGVICPRFVDCYESASFTASFTIRAAQLAGGHELEISTPQAFVNDSGLDLRFDRGTLSVVADDGSTMTVEADNGDPLTLTVTTVTSDSVITPPYDLLWSELQEFLEYVR